MQVSVWKSAVAAYLQHRSTRVHLNLYCGSWCSIFSFLCVILWANISFCPFSFGRIVLSILLRITACDYFSEGFFAILAIPRQEFCRLLVHLLPLQPSYHRRISSASQLCHDEGGIQDLDMPHLQSDKDNTLILNKIQPRGRFPTVTMCTRTYYKIRQ